MLGGTIAGVEKDDEGNIVGFSPERFALGFAAGAGGAKVLGKIANTQNAQNLSTKTLQMLAKHARTNPRAKAVLARIQAKNDMPNQSLDTISPEKIQKGQTNMKLDRFLDSNGKMSEEALRGYAIPMPKVKFNSPNQFRAHFTEVKGKFGIVKTPYKDMEVDIVNAYRHFYINTKNVNRNYFKSAFFETFSDPLFIAKNNSKGRDSVYFYKPFLDRDKNLISLFGIGVDKDGKVIYKTIYDDKDRNRFRQMTKIKEENIVYVKE